MIAQNAYYVVFSRSWNSSKVLRLMNSIFLENGVKLSCSPLQQEVLGSDKCTVDPCQFCKVLVTSSCFAGGSSSSVLVSGLPNTSCSAGRGKHIQSGKPTGNTCYDCKTKRTHQTQILRPHTLHTPHQQLQPVQREGLPLPAQRTHIYVGIFFLASDTWICVNTFAGEKSADKFLTRLCSLSVSFAVLVTLANAGRPTVFLLV